MKRLQAYSLALVTVLMPLAAYAAGAEATPTTFAGVVKLIVKTLTKIVPLIVSLTLLVFIWGLIKFISKAGNEKSHSDGRFLMVWGTIGFFVMVTIWGILSFLTGEFGFGDAEMNLLPQ